METTEIVVVSLTSIKLYYLLIGATIGGIYTSLFINLKTKN